MCDFPISRREWLKVAAFFTASAAAPLLASLDARASAEPDAPVRIGYLPITDAAPLLVAHHNGYFESAGLRAEQPVLLRSWAQLIEAFLSGQVNVVHVLAPMAIWARYGGRAPLKVVAWNHVNGSALTVAPSIRDIVDLGGKTVAVPSWYSIHNVVLQDLLRAHRLTPVCAKDAAPARSEVKLIVMAPSDMPPALAAGQIAGFIVAEPFNAMAEQLKVGKILRFTGDVWQNHACCVVAMQERDLRERPAWAQGVVDALVTAQVWLHAHPVHAAQLLSKAGDAHYTPHSADVLRAVLAPPADANGRYIAARAIVHTSWQPKRIDFQPYPYPSYTEELVRRLKTTRLEGDAAFVATLDPSFVARDLVDDRFVRRAIEAVGGMRAFGQPDTFVRTENVHV